MATIEEQRAKLVQVDADRKQLTAKMRKLAEAFVDQLAAELPDRWNTIARSYVKSHPVKVNDLGEDGVAQVKAKLAELEALSHEVAAHHLSGPKVWQHEVEPPVRTRDGRYCKNTNASIEANARVWARVSEPIAEAEQEADIIVINAFGLDHERIRWQRDHGFLSEDLERIISEYADTDGQLRDTVGLSSDLERDITQSEAFDLWDSA